MVESAELQSARDHLQRIDLFDVSSVPHIDEGFFLLEEISEGDTSESSVAQNLGQTYMSGFQRIAKEKLAQGYVPEPELQSLLRTLTALETPKISSDFDITSLKRETAKRLMDAYFKGYSEAEKKETIKMLLDRIHQE